MTALIFSGCWLESPMAHATDAIVSPHPPSSRSRSGRLAHTAPLRSRLNFDLGMSIRVANSPWVRLLAAR